MLSIDPSTLTERNNYKFLIGSIIPRPIAFVTTLSEQGVLNGAPFSYFNIVSSNPPMISLSIQRVGERRKDTAENIMFNQQFVVHIVDENIVEKVNQTAASLPPEESEIKRARLTPVDSEKITVPGIKEAKIRFECQLEHTITLGNASSGSCELIIGKIVHYHIDSKLYENGKIDPIKLGAVSRLAGHDYATIGDIFSLERPT